MGEHMEASAKALKLTVTDLAEAVPSADDPWSITDFESSDAAGLFDGHDV